jgi:hypothetical protein
LAGGLSGYYLYLSGGVLFAAPPSLPSDLPVWPPESATALVADEDGRVYPPGRWPGIRLQATRAAADAGVKDEDEVIGVCVKGHARAYLLGALAYPAHVINDVIAGQAISVTFCDHTMCSRVFSGGQAGTPLDLSVGGWKKKGLVLHAGDADYAQMTGENLSSPKGAGLPYAEWPHVRTTWRAWREAHPDTDIYVGDASVKGGIEGPISNGHPAAPAWNPGRRGGVVSDPINPC